MKTLFVKSKPKTTIVALILLNSITTMPLSAADLNLADRVPTTHEVIEALRPDSRHVASTPPASKPKYRGATPKSRGIELTHAPIPGNRKSTPIKVPANRSTGNGIALPVLFGFDSFDLTPRAVSQLVPVAEALHSDELTGLVFRIEGHTDVTGPASYNFRLSLQRARTVRDHLVDRHKVSSERVLVVGLGESVLANRAFPKDPSNRRVRIVVHAQ